MTTFDDSHAPDPQAWRDPDTDEHLGSLFHHVLRLSENLVGGRLSAQELARRRAQIEREAAAEPVPRQAEPASTGARAKATSSRGAAQPAAATADRSSIDGAIRWWELLDALHAKTPLNQWEDADTYARERLPHASHEPERPSDPEQARAAAHREAEQILFDARAEADRIVGDARRAARAIVSRAIWQAELTVAANAAEQPATGDPDSGGPGTAPRHEVVAWSRVRPTHDPADTTAGTETAKAERDAGRVDKPARSPR
jgi:hypothetical protein